MTWLKIEVHYENDNGTGKVVAEVPFEDGKHDLPNEYPFNKNVYLSGDDGFSLGYIHIDEKERCLTLAYQHRVKLNEKGKGKYKLELRSGEIFEYQFELLD